MIGQILLSSAHLIIILNNIIKEERKDNGNTYYLDLTMESDKIEGITFPFLDLHFE